MELPKKIRELRIILGERGCVEGAKMIFRRFRRECSAKVYFDFGSADDVIIVAGSGRSGTSWLSRFVSRQYKYRPILEPFWNLHFNGEGKVDFYHNYPYIPSSDGEKYSDHIDRILAGNYRFKGTDTLKPFLFFWGRVIKAIAANLFLPVLRKRHPKVPIIFIVRDPVAVVASRLQRGEYAKPWGLHAHLFNNQPAFLDRLREDGIGPLEPSNRSEDYAISWCYENYFAMNKWLDDDLFFPVYYEDLVLNTDRKLDEISAYVKKKKGIEGEKARALEKKDKVIFTDPRRAHQIKKNPKDHLSRWRQDLGREKIEQVARIVEHFNLLFVHKQALKIIDE